MAGRWSLIRILHGRDDFIGWRAPWDKATGVRLSEEPVVFRSAKLESCICRLPPGAEKMLAPLDLPASTNELSGFSLHPDGKRFLTSIAKWPYNIWMLEGWDQPAQKTWLDGLLRR
jgi:hypothetical protein